MPPKAAAKAAPAATPAANDQQLGLKEQTLFKQVLRFYETKQYKKALKSAEAILKKHPNHGETLAMKGLTYNNLKKKEEAHALVKKGVAMNMKSHVVWHVYGLLYRSEQKYHDAIKCYQQAIKRDPDNLQILKDLSNLQIQRRMLDGFTETRRRILQLKSNNKHNWLAYAIGKHLVGDHAKALEILDALASQAELGQRASNDIRPITYEESETVLYRAMILEEHAHAIAASKPEESQKKLEETIAYLDAHAHEILDRLFASEKRGQLFLALGRNSEAEAEYRKLVRINPENYAYHLGLQKALGYVDAKKYAGQHKSFAGITYTQEQSEALLKLYTEDELFATKEMSKVAAVKRIPLNFTPGTSAQFRTLVAAYMKSKITRGIPSLFSDLETLYEDATKQQVIGELLEEYLKNLRTDNRYEAKDEKDSESPSSFMYALYYAAQHFDHLNQPQRALALIDESIAHTVTSPDSYMLKARIYKHAGDPITAYGYMDTARRMDTQDRYLNVKCVRYALRADEVKKAEDTVQLFLRDGDGLKALEDLQVCWYENNAAEAHMRAKQYGKALKKLLAIDKHFVDIYEDQFDFHGYCLRKATFRAYIDMTRWADQIRGHRYHTRAAINIVKTYLRLYDAPREEAAELEALAVEQNMTEEEKKEAAKRAKKAAAKARAADEKRREVEAAEKAAAQKGKPQAKKEDIDPDPEGVELLKADPLVEATKYLQHLTAHHAKALITHTLAVQVYLRKEKYLLALRHVKRALALEPEHPDTHVAVATFLAAVQKEGALDKCHALVKEILTSETAALAPNGAKAIDLNKTFLAKHPKSLAHRLAAARVLFFVDPLANKAEATKLATQIDGGEEFTRSAATDSLQFLQETVKASAETIAAFQAVALKKYPYAVAFGAKPCPPPAIDAPPSAAQ